MASMSDTGLSNSQSDSTEGGEDNREEEHVITPETDVLSTEHGLEKRSDSTGEITTHTDDSSYYITWTVYIALAVPSVKADTAQSCYHVEYKLLPGDTETMKVDLVLFGAMVKLYKEYEVKILRTWHEGGQMWIGLTEDVKVRVNRDMLISMGSYKMKIQVWNSMDKLSRQARLGRLKALKLSQDQLQDSADAHGGTKFMVRKMRTVHQNKFKKHKSETQLSSNEADEADEGSETGTDFLSLPSDTSSIEDIHKTDTASVEISLVHLLAGETSFTDCFTLCSAGVLEVMCNISLDRPLISDRLMAELNPMVITILSATSMPSSPVPFHVLQERCEPVYCQYKFHNLAMHKTCHHKHATKIYFRDVNVILTGLMSAKELTEFLSGPPLEIEVHDRDAKFEEPPEPQTVSGPGTDPDIQRTKVQSKPKTPVMNFYGVAKLNLSELLFGKKSLKVQIPIRSCPPPPLLHRGRTAQKGTVSVSSASRHLMPQGCYIDAMSTLKVEVKLAHALGAENDCFCDGPFGRIVYLFDYNNSSVTAKLRSEILRINASALNLGTRSLENTERALSDYIMNFKPDESPDLDLVTGFHVQDKRTHIFVLEGLKQKAVKRLWEAVPMKLSGSSEEQVIVLYSSGMSFFRRLYDSLDVNLSPVLLSEPLEAIMRRPRIYVRGRVSPPCFQALTRLNQICQMRKLKDVVQYNLFPSADMILSMNKEFGVSVEQWKQNVEPKPELEISTLPVKTKRHAPLNMTNRDYMKWKHCSQHSPQKQDFIQDNIKVVQEKSKKLQKPKAAVLRMELSSVQPVYNYSIQSLNSKEQTMKLIRKEMAKVPGRRFTYSQQYLSATLEPGPLPCKTDSSSINTTTAWISTMGGDRSEGHPKQPDEARVAELRKPWRENILHANILKPTLTRDVWAWSRRHEDFQLYRKPPPIFSPSPVSIHLAGDSLHQEQLEADRIQFSRWLNKLLPDGSTKPPGRSHIPRFKCHIRKSHKLQDILKDEPKKYSLREPGMILKPFPQLSVMNFADKAKEGKRVALAPGPCADCSLSSKHNAIPRHPSEYSKYHYIGFSKQHSFLYKRTALPLTDHEKNIFTFQKENKKTCVPDVQPQGIL
ncbi:uncharacterized protein cfap92 [Halichoeres trimaculatus]|uniref:uncharacterized protein cfap92 n=1 Tax=Halichoeres trimaculatus TaxID=147232 RepID=UPI003D9F0286